MFPIILWALPVPSPDNVTVPKLSAFVVIFPLKSEFKTTVPLAVNFKSSTGPVETSTSDLKVLVPTAATLIEPAFTVPSNIILFPVSRLAIAPDLTYIPVVPWLSSWFCRNCDYSSWLHHSLYSGSC